MKEILSQITQVEFTIQALETFTPEDKEMLFKLLKKNVAELRKIAETKAYKVDLVC